jgi:hypothetical protein
MVKEFAVLLPLMLAACESEEETAHRQATITAADAAECQSRGFTPDTDRFDKCMSILSANRAEVQQDAVGRVRAGTEVVGQGRPTIGWGS